MQLKRFNHSEFVRKLSVCIIPFLLLFFGFFSNCWHVAEQQWFLDYQHSNESLVVGRMVKSRQDGIFSGGGLNGAGISNDLSQHWITLKQVHDQYAAYLTGITFREYSPYMSQTGGQGMFFSLLDSLIPLSPQAKLKLFYMLTSLLSAIALTLVILWFYCEFGLGVAIFVACSMVFSQWLTVFGRNLWWGLWAFYLPMTAVMYFLRYRRTPASRHFITFGALVFISVFVKCIVNGFEYITTTLIMMVVPLVYYSILDRVRIRQFLKGILAAMLGSFLAVLLSLMILSFQIISVKGSMLAAFEHIVFSLMKRTHGNASDFPDIYTASQSAGTIDVVITYLRGTFFDVNNYLTTSSPFVSRFLFEIRYLYLIVLFLVMSIFVFYRRNNNISTKQRQRSIALIFATCFSILAPLSWYVIFKSHSFIHPHINYILWQMPFTFFGFAVCGLAAKSVFPDFTRLVKRRI